MDERARTYAEIDLSALKHNIELIKAKIPDGCMICAAVKANAYGHDSVHISKQLEEYGVSYFGVASLDEALELRANGITSNILILGYSPAIEAKELIDNNIIQCLYSLKIAEDFSREAAKTGKPLRAHIKIDTGMGRIGLDCRNPQETESAALEAEQIAKLPFISAEGIFTHLACSNEKNYLFTLSQFNRFSAVINKLAVKGISFSVKHCSASSGILNFPEFHLDMVRPGILVYGLHPEPETDPENSAGLRPVMQLKSVVSNVKTIEKGDTVSYNRTYIADEPRRIATAPVGYADGYPRALSNNAFVIVRGKRAPITGRVCMDQIMFDVTHIDGVTEGDAVTLFGTDNSESISCNEIADRAGTISYEIVTGITKRVPRIFLG